jgi:hypothetical protein
MAAKNNYSAPKKNTYTDPYAANIQSKAGQQPEQVQEQPESKQTTRKTYAKDGEFYRFNLKMPIECKTYLQEMVWRKSLEEHRNVTITDYIAQLVLADMEKHPEIMAGTDELNT